MLISNTLIGLLLKKKRLCGSGRGTVDGRYDFVCNFNRKHTLVTKHLPTRDCIIVDRILRNGVDNNFFLPVAVSAALLQTRESKPEYSKGCIAR
jgi:hypothetical protein